MLKIEDLLKKEHYIIQSIFGILFYSHCDFFHELCLKLFIV